MKLAIIVNGYNQSYVNRCQYERFLIESKKLNINATVYYTTQLLTYIVDSEVKINIDCDCVLYLDKDPHIAELLEKSGLRLFNCANAIADCDDKMKTFIRLVGNDIAMPNTISSPLYYSDKDSKDFLNKIESILSYPIVVKKCYSSMGKGVYLAENFEQLKHLRKELLVYPHIYQQAITQSFGSDIRIILVGKKIVACMKRTNAKDFRSNIAVGGSGEVFYPNQEIINIAVKCAELLNLDYCGLDILLGENNKPYICEVNSNAYFNGAEEITKINIAKEYLLYIKNLAK